MSRYSLKVATEFSSALPSFGSQAEAEAALFERKDRALADLQSKLASLDFTPESLKGLEGAALQSGVQSIPPDQIGFYLGEVYCRSAAFNWVVSESPFAPGRYEIGVTRGLVTIMVTKGRTVTLDRNKRLQSLWKEYQRYAP